MVTALPELVPFITLWSGERRPRVPVVVRHGGIAYPRERPGDRDRFGVLWQRMVSCPGQGRPNFGAVHARRQRTAMLRLLCQVCGGPSDRTGEGVLWLVPTATLDDEPDPLITAEPPVCAPCAARAVQACPGLRRGYAALRVREFRPAAVRGALYVPGDCAPVQVQAAGIALDDPRIRWVRAGQLLMGLHRYTPATLHTL
jgi:hypothetical protein